MAKRQYNKSTGRDYRSDYDQFQASEEAKKDRASRNAARAKVEQKVGKDAVKGKDIDHKDGNPRNNSSKNLGVTSKKVNRGKK